MLVPLSPVKMVHWSGVELVSLSRTQSDGICNSRAGDNPHSDRGSVHFFDCDENENEK